MGIGQTELHTLGGGNYITLVSSSSVRNQRRLFSDMHLRISNYSLTIQCLNFGSRRVVAIAQDGQSHTKRYFSCVAIREAIAWTIRRCMLQVAVVGIVPICQCEEASMCGIFESTCMISKNFEHWLVIGKLRASVMKYEELP